MAHTDTYTHPCRRLTPSSSDVSPRPPLAESSRSLLQPSSSALRPPPPSRTDLQRFFFFVGLVSARSMSCVQGFGEIMKPRVVGFSNYTQIRYQMGITMGIILRAHILKMHSYDNAYTKGARLAGILVSTLLVIPSSTSTTSVLVVRVRVQYLLLIWCSSTRTVLVG